MHIWWKFIYRLLVSLFGWGKSRQNAFNWTKAIAASFKAVSHQCERLIFPWKKKGFIGCKNFPALLRVCCTYRKAALKRLNFFCFILGLVNKFLSASYWIPLSRLTYSAYLLHPIVMNVYFGSFQHTTEYTDKIFVSSFNISSLCQYLLLMLLLQWLVHQWTAYHLP